MKGNQESAQCVTEILDIFNNILAQNLLYRLQQKQQYKNFN